VTLRARDLILAAVAAALLAPAALDAQVRPRRPPPAERQALERRFHQRFLEMSSRRLSLEQPQTERLGSILQRGWSARQALQQELETERERFAAAVGDPNTSDEEFRRRLEAMEDLRRREYELWVSEQRALAEFMTPRHRAMFVQMQMRANEAVRDVRRRRPDDRSEDGGGGGGDSDRPGEGPPR
jgi:Spy/CpxP family protein refolding chaperone